MLTVPIVPSSPFTDKELAVWRQRLVNLRLAIAEDIKGTQAFSLETLGNEVILTELHDAREMLELIDNAIRKIDCDDPSPFGICERTGKPIEPERLDLIPWTTLSAHAARFFSESEPAQTN